MLVDVVTIVEHEVQVLFSNPSPGCVVPAFPSLAARGSEPELGYVCAGWRKGAHATDRALSIASAEPVEILACGLQSLDFDVD
jgi:hypothetical protein